MNYFPLDVDNRMLDDLQKSNKKKKGTVAHRCPISWLFKLYLMFNFHIYFFLSMFKILGLSCIFFPWHLCL